MLFPLCFDNLYFDLISAKIFITTAELEIPAATTTNEENSMKGIQ